MPPGGSLTGGVTSVKVGGDVARLVGLEGGVEAVVAEGLSDDLPNCQPAIKAATTRMAATAGHTRRVGNVGVLLTVVLVTG